MLEVALSVYFYGRTGIESEVIGFADFIGRTSGISHVIYVMGIFVDSSHDGRSFYLFASFVSYVQSFCPCAAYEPVGCQFVYSAFMAAGAFVFYKHMVESVIMVEDYVAVDNGISGVVENPRLCQCLEIFVGI